MSDLAKLREEHALIIKIVNRLSKIVEQPSAPSQLELFAVRRELSSALIAHLKAEDWVLYPRLVDSDNARVAGIARAFSQEMGGLAAAYLKYSEHWSAGGIVENWSGYCAETKGIVDALTNRITRENRELYPLLEQAGRPA